MVDCVDYYISATSLMEGVVLGFIWPMNPFFCGLQRPWRSHYQNLAAKYQIVEMERKKNRKPKKEV